MRPSHYRSGHAIRPVDTTIAAACPGSTLSTTYDVQLQQRPYTSTTKSDPRVTPPKLPLRADPHAPAVGAVQHSPSTTPLSGAPVLEEALLIVKWGGVLTHAGRQQAEDLGKIYRMVMYPRSAAVGARGEAHAGVGMPSHRRLHACWVL